MAGGYNGSGTFVRARSCQNDEAQGIGILSANIDEDLDALANGLSSAMPRDGQAPATADWSMAGNKLRDVASPILPTDAVNKDYVDDSDATRLSLSGGTMTGTLNLLNATLSGILSGKIIGTATPTGSIAVTGSGTGIAIVRGTISNHEFMDIVSFQQFGAKSIVHSNNFGSPPARNYTDSSGSTVLELTGGTAGTYTIRALILTA